MIVICLCCNANTIRTRMLDTWFRDVMSAYQSMRDAERSAIRHFLKLDMSSKIDVAIQDRMQHGLIEANRGTGIASAIVNEERTTENTTEEAAAESARDSETTSQKSGIGSVLRRASVMAGFSKSPNNSDSDTVSKGSKTSGVSSKHDAVSTSQLSNKLNPALPNKHLRRSSSYAAPSSTATPPQTLPYSLSSGNSLGTDSQPIAVPAARRRSSYLVKVPNADVPKWQPPRPLPPIEDDGSIVSSSPDISSSNQRVLSDVAVIEEDDHRKTRTTLDRASERDRSESGASENNLEERLLKIGGSKKKKQPWWGGCCVIS
jgi:hypothetical protein